MQTLCLEMQVVLGLERFPEAQAPSKPKLSILSTRGVKSPD